MKKNALGAKRALTLICLLPALTLASYGENPDDPAARQAAESALAALGANRGAAAIVAAPALELRAQVVGLVGVHSGLTADITPLAQAVEALDARVSDTLIEVSLASDVLFDFDSDRLKESAEDALNDLKTLISESEVLEVIIVGHTDSRGSDEYNLDLSRRRAVSVSQWLVMAGLEPELFTFEGRGETEPVAPNQREDGSDDPDGRALNRRVEISIRIRKAVS